ncbi:unnamed protein product [Meganyctiphanes norvegica]|uniref:Prolactin receptor n=1 Tax=Meganyctiphanes norvegica TaxID=48144 RepID=A0AAV2QVG3_MEGNR
MTRGTNTDSSKGDEVDNFRSDSRCAPRGPDQALHKGPSESLLLSDYQPWHGPNPDNSLGQSGMAKGPDNSLRQGPSGISVRGPDPALRKGPAGLAKGSQFFQGLRKENSFSTKNL